MALMLQPVLQQLPLNLSGKLNAYEHQLRRSELCWTTPHTTYIFNAGDDLRTLRAAWLCSCMRGAGQLQGEAYRQGKELPNAHFFPGPVSLPKCKTVFLFSSQSTPASLLLIRPARSAQSPVRSHRGSALNIADLKLLKHRFPSRSTRFCLRVDRNYGRDQ